MANIELATQYGLDVLDGKIPACKWVRLAVQRQFEDLEHGHKRGLYFDPDEAAFIIDFYSLLCHSKGEKAGQPFILEPWQQFILSTVFGWKREDGFRRFRTVYEEIPRKNGKSTKLAGIGLYGLTADGEAGAEIYVAATMRDQAKITFDEAVRMRDKSPALQKKISKVKNNLHVLNTHSKFVPLGADADTLDGLNPHIVTVDELHAHKTRAMWDVLESGTGARKQPLLWAITTAGFNKLGVCYEVRTYCTKVLERIVEDDSFFGIIYTIDEGDAWDSEEAWRKANPNYGVSVEPDDLARKCVKAREMPAAQNNFLCKHLNVWTNAETLWMNMEKWAACGGSVDLKELEGAECYAGLDLASTSDIAALVLVFRHDGKVKTFARYYLPEEAVRERSQKAQVPYDTWAKQGLFVLTPGNVTDYNFIKADIKTLRERFRIKEIAFDRWNSSQLVNDLMEDGAPMVGFGQGYASMNPAMRELERLVLNGELRHGDDPVLTWMASNLAIKTDEAGNIKPAKNKSVEKIDGMVALCMAIGRLMVHEGEGPSVYETRGVISLADIDLNNDNEDDENDDDDGF